MINIPSSIYSVQLCVYVITKENLALKVTTAEKLANKCLKLHIHSIFLGRNLQKKILFRPLQKISWKKCIKATEKKFKYALGHIYVREKEAEGRTKDDIEDVLNIISKIQGSLEEKISENTWMDARELVGTKNYKYSWKKN